MPGKYTERRKSTCARGHILNGSSCKWCKIADKEQRAARKLTNEIDRNYELPPTSIDPIWRTKAACLGTDPTLFDIKEEGQSYAAALKICDTCPVTKQCLASAVHEKSIGTIRGGTLFYRPRKCEKDHIYYQSLPSSMKGCPHCAGKKMPKIY